MFDTLASIVIAASCALPVAGQEEGASPEGQPKPHAQLEAIKTLVGDWESGDADQDGKPDVAASYKLTSGGSAVVETLFPGAEHEMATVYHLSGGEVYMTHYCMLGNQPRLKAKPGDARRIVFEFLDGLNIDPAKDTYMGAMTMTIVDADHLKTEWSSFKDGQREDDHATFEMVRKK